MAIERVVVKNYFCVERNQTAVACNDAGIDFNHGRIRFDKRAVKRLEKWNGGAYNFRREPQSECNFPSLERLETACGVNRLAQNRFRMVFRYFLNFHSARGAGHENRHAGYAIHKDADVKFALDVQPFFDQKPMDDAAFFTRLRRDKFHSEYALGV